MRTILLLLLSVAAAAGQAYRPTAISYTNAIPDNTTNAVASTNLDLTRYEETAVQVAFTQTSTSAAGVVLLRWKTSLDATNWPGHYSHSQLIAGNGTNLVCTNFVLNVSALGYLRLDSVGVSSNGWPITNLSILYTPKPYRRERI